VRPLSGDTWGLNCRSVNGSCPIMSPSCPGLSPIHTPSERSPGQSIGTISLTAVLEIVKQWLQGCMGRCRWLAQGINSLRKRGQRQC